MSAPAKPWERPGLNYQNNASLPLNNMAASPLGQERIQAAVNSSATASPFSTASPPPVPPRQSEQSTLNSSNLGYRGFGGYSNFGGFGGYSNPLSYGGMYSSPSYSTYGGYGHNRDIRSTFALQAEESSRPAFESIESIVYAVTSVGMMLDSTFQAVYSSFRAVIGVADNFTRLKSQLVQVFSALAFIRTLKYISRKFLEFLRLRPKGEADKLWKEAFEEAAALASFSDKDSKKSTWPILLFFGIIMGGPYLIWRLISAFSGSTDEKGWAKGEEDHFVARANFSFEGQGREELTFSAGQHITVAPKEIQPRVRGWLLASVDGQVGMIPANYVTILGKRKGSRHLDSAQPTPLMQSESSMSLAQESQYSSASSTQQMASVPENELESAFEVNTLQSNNSLSVLPHNTRNQEASNILNDVHR